MLFSGRVFIMITWVCLQISLYTFETIPFVHVRYLFWSGNRGLCGFLTEPIRKSSD